MYYTALVFTGVAIGLATPTSVATPQYISAKLTSESDTPRPGQTILVGIQMTPKPGWHGYWSNPGESGLAPVVEWIAPNGVHFGPLQHPAPTLMRMLGLTSYVHAGPHFLLAPMSIDRMLPVGTILPITAKLSWAACSDRLCVPQRAELTLRLRVGNGSPSSEATALRGALAKQPKLLVGGTAIADLARIVLVLPASAHLRPNGTHFFPDENGYWNPNKAHVTGDRPLKITSPAIARVPAWITGVATDGISAYRLKLRVTRLH